jgi:hypothetical protein
MKCVYSCDVCGEDKAQTEILSITLHSTGELVIPGRLFVALKLGKRNVSSNGQLSFDVCLVCLTTKPLAHAAEVR